MKQIKFNNVQVGAEFMDAQGFRSIKLKPYRVFPQLHYLYDFVQMPKGEGISFSYNAISVKPDENNCRELRYYRHDEKVYVNA